MIRPTQMPLAALAGLFIMTALADPASACSCIGPSPVCRTFWEASAVFVGEVVAIDDASGTYDAGDRQMPIRLRRVHLRVTEAFSGVTTKEVDVETGMGGGDCGYAFAIGASYVVFAHQDGGKLSTGICSPTKPVAEAAADLAYLRSLAGPKPARGRIYGTARFWDDNENDRSGVPAPRLPYAGAQVVATGSAGRFDATSGRDGAFEILVPPGRYEIAVEVPAGKYAAVSSSWPAELTDSRGCAEVPVVVHSDGHVSGVARDAVGRPIGGLTIELLPANRLDERSISPQHHVRTTADGAFDITQVPPGRYVVGFNTPAGLPYPRVLFSDPVALDTPRIVAIGAGARVRIGDVHAPASLRLRELAGVVNDAAGSPIEGARVYLKVERPREDTVGEPAVTGPDGRFTLAVLDGYRYSILAEAVVGTGAARRVLRSPSEVVPGIDPGFLTLTIRP